MALAPGVRLGPYEVVALLGEGGMGKVWRAHHTALRRDDALKVLPDAFAADADRLARFRREAQVLASLNHPNIAHVYGLEQADGLQALVMELVEGPTLADRIAQGPIPVDEALPVAKQIADALEAAHEQGIIHRDLKPANIKLRPDGTVKVLDFGLAKVLEPVAVSNVNTTASPTITSPAMMSRAGVLLGTPAYMSPEQARGKAVDKRSDIWAFGCVLYEMLTGRRAFEDEDVSMTLAKILQRDPDFSELPTDTPASIRHTVRLCLEKDFRERVQAMGDVRLSMAGAFGTTSSAERIPTQTGRRPIAIGVSALVLASILTGTVVWFTTRPASEPVVRTEIGTSGGAALSIQGLDRDLVVTPDGARVVYRGADGLFVRGLSELEPVPLGRVDDPRSIFVSPDGQWVGFFTGGSMNRIPIGGGSPITMASIGIYTPRGATWGSDGTVIFATSAGGIGLQRVSAAGGEPTVLTKLDATRNESGHHWPEFLPGGEAILFTIVRTGARLEDAEIAMLDLATGARTTILRGGSHAHYVPSGHLVYGTSGGTLQAVPFDLRQRTIVGTPAPVVERVAITSGGAVDAAIASNGTLVYAAGVVSSGQRRLVWVNRDGTVEPVRNIEPNAYTNLRLSPGNRSVALLLDGDIWIHDLVTGRRTRLTRDQSATNAMAWDPAGSRLAYTSRRAGSQNTWIQPVDGSSDPRQLTKLDGMVDVDSWSPDGQVLAVHHHRPDGGLSMLMLPMRSDGAVPESFVDNEAWAEGATFSPDGHYVAYMSRDTGRYEVYIRAYPRTGGSTPVSIGGGREALWTATGELFYRNEAGDRMMVAPVVTQPTLRVGNSKEVFRGRFSVNLGGSPRPIYDLTRDGRRFLMLQDTADAEELSQPRLVVVQNWTEELKRLVPTR